jgi:hypothetical protein
VSRLFQFYRDRFGIIAGATFFCLCCLAWWNRFIQDDAFISFRYADHLARGLGLVYNPGEHLEGYTNFLWACIMSVVISAHGDPALWSQIFGMFFFFCSLLATFRLSKLIFRSDDLGLITILFLGTNYTFSCYATGGLETQMQASLFLLSSYLCVRNLLSKQWSSASLAGLSFLFTGALFTRLDSAILVVIVSTTTFVALWKENLSLKIKIRKFALLIFPLALCVTLWFLWKLSYYGDILPNTFYVKVSSLNSIGKGLKYLCTFLLSYLLFPFIVVGIFAVRKLFSKERAPLLILLLVVLGWLSYIVRVGGDFMEFRFMVPVLPFIFILITWLIFSYVQQIVVRMILVLLVFGGSVYHVTTFSYSNEDNIEPIRQLSGHLFNKGEQWVEIGKILGEAFHNNPEVTIAVTAAGAIPYYSRLTTIDMLGMNDRWVAEHGEILGSRPGHQRIAPLSYLMERNVNLVISHPLVIDGSAPITKLPMPPATPGDTLPNAKAIELPIDNAHKLIVLYLHRNQIVDDVIQQHHWKTHELRKR